MSQQAEWERLCQLGFDPSTSDEVREQLLRDRDPRVRAAATRHASPRRLRDLANDSRAEVRVAVATNGDTPADVLLALVSDRSASVRWWLVTGARFQMNKEVLRRLRDDEDQLVADTAGAALDDMRLYRRILNLPEEVLAALAHRLIEKRQG